MADWRTVPLPPLVSEEISCTRKKLPMTPARKAWLTEFFKHRPKLLSDTKREQGPS